MTIRQSSLISLKKPAVVEFVDAVVRIKVGHVDFLVLLESLDGFELMTLGEVFQEKINADALQKLSSHSDSDVTHLVVTRQSG